MVISAAVIITMIVGLYLLTARETAFCEGCPICYPTFPAVCKTD